MKRRMPGILIGAVGVVLIAVTLYTNLFTVAPAFERMTDAFRPEMKSAELTDLRADLRSLSAIHDEFTTKVVPQLASATGVTPQQLSARLAEQYPAVSGGMAKVPEISTQFTAVVNLLDAEQSRFEEADAIPTKSLPATTVPWALAAAGVVCLAVGFLVARRRGGALAVELGLLLIIAPLVMTLPGKAEATDTMSDHLRPVYTAEFVQGAETALAGMKAMGTELQTKLLPGLGTMLKLEPAQVQAYLAANYPTVTSGIASMPAALARFDRLVGTFDGSLDDFDTAKDTELVPIVRVLIVAGVAVTGLGLWVLLHGTAGAFAVRRARIPVGGVPRAARHH